MAKDDVTAEVSGLQLSNNTFSASPPGSLLVAENCVMPQKGVVEPRRGQARLYTMPTATELAMQVVPFSGSLVVNYATSKTSLTYGLGLAADPIVGFSGGPYNPVDCDGFSESYARMKFAQVGGFLSFCTSDGSKVLESTSSVPRNAGLLRMPDPSAAMYTASALGTGTGLAYGSARAYRTVLRKPTSDGSSLLSPPSGRTVVANRILAPVGSMVRAANVVTVTLPGTEDPGLSPGDTFTIDPGEATFPAATETVASVTANVITYADVAADSVNTVVQDLDTGPRPVQLIISLPPDATTGTPVRVYRSLDTSSSTIEPSDEMFLVAELTPDGTDISLGFMTYLDVTPSSVIDDPLYTNPQTGEGASQANQQPPVYRDISSWGGRTWYANTTGPNRFNLQMLGVGAPDGIQNNDTLTIGITGDPSSPYVFTFKTTPVAAGDVQIVSNSTPSFNIQQTAQNLIEQIQAVFYAAAVPVRAYSTSTQDGAPGKMLLEQTNLDSLVTNFDIIASRPASWAPALSTTDELVAVAERRPNGLSYSKLGQPESVPLVNFTSVGSSSYPIKRILGLREALLVFKDGDGIYSVTGSAPFQVQQISTANIISPDCCSVFADAAWVYTDQGILRVTDAGGAAVISRPIETALNRQLALAPDDVRDWGFSVPYETERRIYFFLPFEPQTSGRPNLMAWCYNNATQAWTGPLYEQGTSGVVDPSVNLFAFGTVDETWQKTRITIERKYADESDYVDASFSASVTAVDGAVVTLASILDVAAGDGFRQVLDSGLEVTTIIAALRPDVGTNCVELYGIGPWVVGSCTISKAYLVRLQFQPGGNPASRKTLTRLSWLFMPDWYRSFMGKSLLMTDQAQADNEVDIPFGGFGFNPFGAFAFGDRTPLVYDVNPIGSAWTNAAQFFPGIETREAFVRLRLQGFVMQLESVGAPTSRKP